MERTIIKIDEDLCDGCGLCASACHEGAIAIVDGKAKLIRDDYCDGMGDCLPACPTGAITFEKREAAAYDEAAVAAHLAARKTADELDTGDVCPSGSGCAGMKVLDLAQLDAALDAAGFPKVESSGAQSESDAVEHASVEEDFTLHPSMLRNWPVQIKLAPVQAPYFTGADLLVAADCTAFAYADAHRDLMQGKVTLIGCPKLDAVDYADKLGAIIASNDIRSVTVARMQVPCCGGIEMAAKRAVVTSGKQLLVRTITISLDGQKIADVTE